jgi:hypothetical protein
MQTQTRRMAVALAADLGLRPLWRGGMVNRDNGFSSRSSSRMCPEAGTPKQRAVNLSALSALSPSAMPTSNSPSARSAGRTSLSRPSSHALTSVMGRRCASSPPVSSAVGSVNFVVS